VEGLANLLRRVALYHIGHRHAGGIKEIPDIQVVGRQDELEESALIHGQELGIPGTDIHHWPGCFPFGFLLIIALMVLGPNEDLFQNRRIHIGQRNKWVILRLQCTILQQGFNGARTFRSFGIGVENFAIGGLQLDDWHGFSPSGRAPFWNLYNTTFTRNGKVPT